MPQLCAIADEVSKVHAICVKCGQLASFSHRTVKNEKQFLLGETAEYEPLCRDCLLYTSFVSSFDNYLQSKGYHLNTIAKHMKLSLIHI